MVHLLLALSLWCGSERRLVKIAADQAADQIGLTAQRATVSQLSLLEPPPIIRPQLGRTAPYEMQLFQVDSTLTLFKLEQDNDYHLVLSDQDGNTMIAEIPDPRCLDVNSLLYNQMALARLAFTSHYATGKNSRVPRRSHPESHVIVTGVGMFDLCHGQQGRAANCFELHPVTAIEFK